MPPLLSRSRRRRLRRRALAHRLWHRCRWETLVAQEPSPPPGLESATACGDAAPAMLPRSGVEVAGSPALQSELLVKLLALEVEVAALRLSPDLSPQMCQLESKVQELRAHELEQQVWRGISTSV